MNSFIDKMNEKGYIIIDNLFPSKTLDYIQDVCTHSEIYGVGRDEGTVSVELTSNYFPKNSPIWDKVYEGKQMVSIIYNENGVIQRRPIYDLANVIVFKIQEIFNYDVIFSPIRYKINLQHQLDRSLDKLYNTPHTDHRTLRNDQYYSIIFYINDSDGDTFIFNEKHRGSLINNLTIKTRISPKRGRCVIFPYNTLHAGNHPLNNKIRLVMNLNVQLESFIDL